MIFSNKKKEVLEEILEEIFELRFEEWKEPIDKIYQIIEKKLKQ